MPLSLIEIVTTCFLKMLPLQLDLLPHGVVCQAVTVLISFFIDSGKFELLSRALLPEHVGSGLSNLFMLDNSVSHPPIENDLPNDRIGQVCDPHHSHCSDREADCITGTDGDLDGSIHELRRKDQAKGAEIAKEELISGQCKG